ncbi:MAG: hypothetical protein KAX05_01065 [Bacteroidales bacterium]|nr:hypothetical protein [Bacteroidales bacterium]
MRHLKIGWLQNKYIYIFTFYAILIFSSCSYEFPEEDFLASSGSADFSNFISVGGSITAGYMNGSLYNEGQSFSWPSILARQMALVDGGTYIQPLIHSENGYNREASFADQVKGRYVYQFISRDTVSPSIVALDGEFPASLEEDISLLNNWGVPGIKSFQITEPGLSGNIYYDRLTGINESTSLIQNAANTNPTFFTLLIGLHDVLNYALSGGTGNPDPVPSPEQIEKNDLTPVSVFEDSFNQAVSLLTTNLNTRGIIATLPNVTEFAYFTTIQPNQIRIATSDTQYDDFDALYDFYKEFNNAVKFHNWFSPKELHRPTVVFIGGFGLTPPQPLVINDKNLPDAFYPDGRPIPKIRLIQPDERVLLNLPIEQLDAKGFGYMIPVPDEYILTLDEMNIIEKRVNQFNNFISQAVQQNQGQLALVDLKTILHQMALSTLVDEFEQPVYPEKLISKAGVPLRFDLEIDGFFSLDGKYPNPKGSAYIANRFVEILNDKFGARLPLTDINHFKGNTFYNAF